MTDNNIIALLVLYWQRLMYLLKRLGYPFSWTTINSLGKTKVIQSSYFFLILVPIILKFYDTAANTELIQFELPFHWLFLFFGALFVSIANTVYFFFCPSLVKSFRDFNAFLLSGRDATYLANQLKRLARPIDRDNPTDIILLGLEETHGAEMERSKRDLEEIAFKDGFDEVENGPHDSRAVTPEFFWRVYDVVNLHGKTWRWIASVSYILGLGLVAAVLIEKIYYVIKYTLMMSM